MPRVSLSPQAVAVLDGLRGLAALMVVASHASNYGMHLVPGLSLSGTGKQGVYLFFVLSAFLLTLQWLQADPAQRASRAWLGQYLWRRVLRIYPLYLLVLLVGWALPRNGLGVALDGGAVWRHLTLQEGLGVYWSVPVEFMYYGVIPLLAWWLTRPIPVLWRAAVLICAAAASIWWFPPAQAPDNSTVFWYYLPIFLCGSAAAWWVASGRAWRAPSQPDAPPAPTRWSPRLADALLLLVLAASVPSLWHWIGIQVKAEALHREFLAWGLVWTAVLLALVGGRLPLWAALLSTGAMRACGRWCFGIYLLHMPALMLCNRLPLPGPLKAWVAVGIALVLAALANRWIERPAQRWGQRM